MDTVAAKKPVKINRWLPLGRLQGRPPADVHSWVYRLWVLLSVLAAVGYLLYCLGLARVAG